MTLSVRDDRGVALSWPAAPQRIVSLVPSDTYTLLRLGAGARLVGRTSFCTDPQPEVEGVVPLGGPLNPDIRSILALRPDVVVANWEDNRRPAVDALEQAGVSVLVSHPCTAAAALDHAARLARLLPDRLEPAAELLREARQMVARAERRRIERVRTFVPVWLDPLVAVGGGCFASDVLRLVGGALVVAGRPAERSGSYPRPTLAAVGASAPELLLLPDEPYDFTDAEAAKLRAAILAASPLGELALRRCSGQDLFWYGLRFTEGLEQLSAVFDEVRAER